MDRAATKITEEEYAILFDPFLTWSEIHAKLKRLRNASQGDPQSSSQHREEECQPVLVSTSPQYAA
jgi:hypothetical protein